MIKNKSRQVGFTLIELMITVAIVAILARIAYPTYIESVNRAKRAQAQTALISLSQALERYFTKNNSYYVATNPSSASAPAAPTTGGSSPASPGASPAANLFAANVPTTGAALYTLGIVFKSSGTTGYDGYTLTATRNPAGAMKNDKCGDFTFTAAGAKNLAGNNGKTVADCWK